MAKDIFEELWGGSKTAAEIVKERGLEQITDDTQVRALVENVLAQHPDKVNEYKGGKLKLFGFFVGQVMKASKGQANPEMVNSILKEKLSG